ncbi:MAG: alpha-amylase [Gemmatimonadaceae bacterium]|nr:alpha-amylase [Chitinophagaceae bacterium]
MGNLTIIQFFHWYYPSENNLWLHAAEQAAHLKEMGFNFAWLPPAYKSAKGDTEPGYAVYDLYDLGEFYQKGSIRTKHGTREEYLRAIGALRDNGIGVLADVIFNHRFHGDGKEIATIQKVSTENRTEFEGEPMSTDVSTVYNFPGRNKKYSNYTWDHHSFSGTSVNGEIFMIHNEYTNGTWGKVISNQFGNFDYLMGDDVEFRNPFVREELKQWGKWYIENTGVAGFRLDALKHMPTDYYAEWIDFLKDTFRRDFFFIGECWRNDRQMLMEYLDQTAGRIQLFDVPLHANFFEASQKGRDYDLRSIFNNTLVQVRPERTITFVDNHDTQPLQALESFVEAWFKPLATAVILLREQGIPCVFYPAVYGAAYSDEANGQTRNIKIEPVPGIERMLHARRDLAFGYQHDYFDHPNVVGWTRGGKDEMALSGFAVLISNGDDGYKTMSVGRRNATKVFVDLLGHRPEKVTIDQDGGAEFFVSAGSVSVWVDEKYLSVENNK